MARPTKQGLDFPLWKPQRGTQMRMESSDYKTRYKALRNSSGGFINRKDVREFIFNRDGNKCYLCGSSSDLQIDHINSVHSCAIGNYPVYKLNTEENLATICAKCNAAKLP